MQRTDLLTHAPKGVFHSSNPLTPTVIGFARVPFFHGRVAWIEVAEGSAFLDWPEIYGVTFRRSDGSQLWQEGIEDPSKPFPTEAEALAYVASFTEPSPAERELMKSAAEAEELFSLDELERHASEFRDEIWSLLGSASREGQS